MSLAHLRSLEIVRKGRGSTGDAYIAFPDHGSAEVFLGQYRSNCIVMSQLRVALAQTEFSSCLRSDSDVIHMLASLLAARRLLVKAQNSLSRQIATETPMSGYFTLLKFLLRAKSCEQLEAILGYRRGRISSQGTLIYGFQEVPELDEFEVAGSTITPQSTPDGKGWDQVDLPARKADLAKVAAYHQNTMVPTFDEIQK